MPITQIFVATFVLIGSAYESGVIVGPSSADDNIQLTSDNYEAWRSFIVPDESELTFLEIPWRTEFGKAVIDADRQDKPILLWAMNGHPLGCT